jgi:cyanophycin synthetase
MKKEKNKCEYCGNNQANHTISWISNTLSVIFEPTDRIILGSLLGRSIDIILQYSTRPYLFFLETVRLISWNEDINKALTKRSFVIWEEAKKRNIKMEQLVIFGKPVEFYKATLNKKMIYFESIPKTKKGFIQSIIWMDDKLKLKEKLEEKNIPVPKGKSVFTYKQALSIFKKIDGPVILKPRIGSRGRHSLTHIKTKEDLKKAFKIAKKMCFFVIIEEHLVGSVYRGTCINNRLVGVLEGMPPRITGNGHDNINSLIEQKNKKVVKPVSEVPINKILVEFLKKINYKLDSILEDGKTIDLSEKIGISYGGNSKEIFNETNKDLKEVIEKAAEVVNAGVIGFDFIIEDPKKNIESQKWGIIECNSLPFINLHHYPEEGDPINIAKSVWDEIEVK